MFLMAAMAASSGGTQLLLPQEQVKEEHHHQQQQQQLGSPRPGLSVAQVHVPLTVQQTLGDAIEKGNLTMQNSLQAYLDTLGRVSPESAASYEPIRSRRRRRRPANTTSSGEKGTSEANQANSNIVEPRSNVTMQNTDKGNAKRKSRCPTTPLRDGLNNDQAPYEQNPTATKKTKLDEGTGLRYTHQKPQENKEQLLELQTLPDSVSGQESSPEIPEEEPDALHKKEVHVSFEEFPYKIDQDSSHEAAYNWLGAFLESLVDCTVPSAEGMKDPEEDSLLRFFSITKEASKKPTECTNTFDTHADWSCRLISSVVASSWLPITH